MSNEHSKNVPIPPPIANVAHRTASQLPPSLRPPQRKSKRWIGYLVAVLGFVGFIATIVASIALKLEGETVRYAAQSPFLFMALAFWIGTIIVAVQKGYHFIVGILLGAISPLGLLILTLMPDLAEKRAKLQESQKIGSQVQRTPTFPGS